jgi:hypothetical protein
VGDTRAGAQAGLSWATILAKREGYRAAFHGFDIDECAAMTSADVNRLLDAKTATSEPTAARTPHARRTTHTATGARACARGVT